MKKIFKLIVLITIALNFTACDNKKPKVIFLEKKPYVNPYTSMEAPKQRDKELFDMGVFHDRSDAISNGNTEKATIVAMAYYEQLEDYEKAIEWLEYSNSIKPTGKNSDSACTVYSAKGDFKEAIKWCKQAVDLGYEKSITGLGLVYNSAKDYDNAIIWLKKGDELKQDGAATSLGFAYNRLGNKEEAYKYYKKAVKDFPKSVLAVSNLIHFYHNDLKDNVRASAWAIAGINNIFLANSVADLLIYDWRIPIEDIKKGYELQLTSDEFPYNYDERISGKLGMITQQSWDGWINIRNGQIKDGIINLEDIIKTKK